MCLTLEGNVRNSQACKVYLLEDISKYSVVVELIMDASQQGRDIGPDKIDGTVCAADRNCLNRVVLTIAEIANING